MRRLVVVWIVVGLGVAGWAQQAPPSSAQPPSQAPQFRTSVDLVRLDVSVLDRRRRPVRGLDATEFTVFENGVEQPISAFSPVDLPDPMPDPTAAPWLRNVAPDMNGNAEVQQRRLFILAIDDATIENDVHAIKAVKDIARSVVGRLGPADLMSVVFTRDNRNAQDFTADRARLLKAVDSFTVGFRGMGGMDDLWYLNSVGVLDRAVDFLSDVPERRKAIIYVGQGLPFDIGGLAPVNTALNPVSGAASTQALQMRIKDQMTDAFDRAKRANVNVYTVDPCGLRVVTPPPSTCQPGLEVDYLINIAAATGGRPIINSNDFEPGLTALFQENASYYLIGYQPIDAARDGKFRRLEVRVDRPDVDVRTRSGYDAPREISPARPRSVASPLSRALAGVVPKGDLPMQVTAAPFAIPKKNGAALLIAAGFKQPIREADERTVENVDLQVSAFDADGKTYGNVRSRADVTIRAGSSGSAEYEVFTQIDLKPGRYQVRVAAFVNSLDTAGSVYFDVDVPDFAQAPLTLSGLLISATPGPFFAPKDALKAVVPVIPTTHRVFAQGHTVSAFARVYRGHGAKQADVAVRMTIRNTQDEVVIDRLQQIAPGKFSDGAADVRFDVPVVDLAAGRYLLTIEAESGTTRVSKDSRFQVVR